ncbi:2Fe-2S iron-sulfur cluster-binding protein [Streptomyces justiciae]|uniref:2Fe-2S iron-sulfur cluster-binding protein n=1 Tax=Streptomyces justiciae TaxID=2780140 RepID=UPI002119AA8C|nr:2Fe-2S iron-sulfur cluster-binding protein [Streptomyces justiciae]MCW8379713.1 2Fe-2S iron-sulfur cluster-binding protein [Streptomyces justiciae]
MPKVVFVLSDGTQTGVDARAGDSVMVTATQQGVDGIVGECGGNTSCATCHVWVRAEFVPLVGDVTDSEEDLLDLAVSERRAGSRLSCQIVMTWELDGLTVEVPPEQP